MGVLEYQKKSNRIFSEFDCHVHTDVYEIYYFISGDADIMVEGKVYKLTPYSLIIFPPKVLHGIQINSNEDYVRYCLYIDANEIIPERRHLLADIIPNMEYSINQEILYNNVKDFHLEQFFAYLKKLETQAPDVKDELEPIFTEAILAQIKVLKNTLRSSPETDNLSNKMLKIISYINNHISDPLYLDSIASTFYISKNYLNLLFKENLGTTVGEYIRIKRVALAKQYIKDGQTAMNAAFMAGFSDYSSFYRAYTKYNRSSPREIMHVK